MSRARYLRPRRLVVDDDLYRRRVQGATLRELAGDYGISHTTLSRHLRRPDAKARLRDAHVTLRVEERQRREQVRQEARARRAKAPVEDGVVERPKVPESVESRVAAAAFGAPPRPPVESPLGAWRDPYLEWLDLHDHGRPLARRERWSDNDERAAAAAADGLRLQPCGSAPRRRAFTARTPSRGRDRRTRQRV